MFASDNFPQRQEEHVITRYLLDIFYGFSVVRRKRVLVNVSFFIFDLVLYPNALFFMIMMVLFFLVVLAILIFTILNYFGITTIDLDQYAADQMIHRHGLTPGEFQKLEELEFSQTLSGRKMKDKLEAKERKKSFQEDSSQLGQGQASAAETDAETGAGTAGETNIKQNTEQVREPLVPDVATGPAPPRDISVDFPQEAHNQSDEMSEVMCAICYVPFDQDARVTLLPQCNHVFHKGCIAEWFKSHGTCPICRCDIKELLKDPQDDLNTHFLNKSIFDIDDL